MTLIIIVDYKLKKELSYQYSVNFRYIQPFPWEEKYTLDMEELYMKLTWEKGLYTLLIYYY